MHQINIFSNNPNLRIVPVMLWSPRWEHISPAFDIHYMWQGCISTLEPFNINFQSVISLFQLPRRGLRCQLPRNFVFALYLAPCYHKGVCLHMFKTLCSQKCKCQTAGRGKRPRKSDDSWPAEHPSSAGKEGFSVLRACLRVFNCVKCNKSRSVLTKQTVELRCPEGLYHEQCWHQSIDAWQVMSHFPCPERRSHLYGDDYR